MRVKTIAAAAALSLGLVFAGAASAQSGPIPNGGVTIEDIVLFLQNKGYKAEVKVDSRGERYVASGSGGINFEVTPYDCNTPPRCASVEFAAGFDLNEGLTAERINEWNSTKRYLKAHIDSEGDPYVKYDVNTSPGKTWEGFTDDYGVWTNILAAFTDFIGW